MINQKFLWRFTLSFLLVVMAVSILVILMTDYLRLTRFYCAIGNDLTNILSTIGLSVAMVILSYIILPKGDCLDV